MSMLAFLILLVVSMAAFSWAVGRKIKQSKRGRDPVNKNEKLLRQAGEGLRDLIDDKREAFLEEVLHGLYVPAVVAFIPAIALYMARDRFPLHWGIGLIVVGFFISFVFRLKRVTGRLEEIQNLRLGLMGERLVGTQLEALGVEGYHVYHDAQAQGAQKAFNIDHIVVGPSGVYAVETKTRRKPDGKDGHRVEYNGAALLWPGGADTDSPQQVCHAARWLQDHLQAKLGMTLAVKPVLAIPGWYVTMTAKGPVSVVNHKQLGSAIVGKAVLDQRTVDLVRRQMDSLCRDVPSSI